MSPFPPVLRGPVAARRARRVLVSAVVVSTALVSVQPALAAELVTAELVGTHNTVEVEQGKTASFTIALSALGNAACGSTHSASVKNAFSISGDGVLSTGTTFGGPVSFSAPGSGNGNCGITGAGTVTAEVSAAVTTPRGTYTALLSEGAGTTAIVSSNTTAGKFEDKTATTLTFTVVAPANTAPAAGNTPANAAGDEGSTLTTSGSFTDVDNNLAGIAVTSGAGTVTADRTPAGALSGSWSWSLPTTDDVSGSATVTATDASGLTATQQFTYAAANVAPRLTVAASDVLGNEGDTLSATGSFADVTGDPLTVTKVSGAGAVVDNGNGTWSWSLATTNETSGTVQVAATDGDGGTQVDSFDFAAANVAPGVRTPATDTTGNEGSTLSTAGAFSDVASDALSVTSDGDGGLVGNADGTWSWGLAGVDQATGTVTVTATDGLATGTDEFTYEVINVAPAVAVAASDASGDEGTTLTSGGTFSDVVADPMTITKVSGPGTVTANPNGTWSWTFDGADDLAGTVVVQADDGDGGVQTDSFDVVVRNAAPTVSKSAADATGSEGNLLLTDGAFSDVPADTLTITAAGPGDFVMGSGGAWSWSLEAADQTSGSVTVTATDDDGGTITDTFDFSAVDVAPQLVDAADDATANEGQTLTASGAFQDVAADSITVALVSGAGTLTDLGGGDWSWSLGTTDQAGGTVLVRATDKDGVTSVADEFTYTAANVAPTVLLAPSDASGVEGDTLAMSGSFTDIAADLPLTITKTDGAGTVTATGNGTWSWSLDTDDQTSGTVTVQADDGDGGLAPVSFDYTAGNVAPAVVITPLDAAGLEGVTLSTSGSFTDVAGDVPVTITLVSGAGTVTDHGDNTWTWNLPTTDDGSGTVVVEANDGDTGIGQTEFTFTATNRAPAVGAAPVNAAGDEGTTLSTSGSFTDVSGDQVAITQTSGSGSVTDNGDGTWTWSLPTTDQTSGSVTVQADDGEGGATPVTFTYSAANVAPAVGTAPGDGTGNEGTTLATSGSFTDVPADRLTIAKTDGAGTVTDNGDGTWSWSLETTDNTSGTVTVQADDGDGGLTESTFTYTASNVAPAIGTAPADATGNEGTTLGTSGSFTDLAADPLTITKTDGPGNVIDNHDGTWSWSLGTTDETSGTVTVQADDGDAGTTPVTFSYTATNVAPAVGVTPAAATGNEGATLGTAGSFTDVAGDQPVTITKTAGPGSLFDNHDGTWSWSLATTDETSGTVTVQADDGDEGVTPVTFSYSASNAAPTVVDEPVDASGVEGDTLATSGSFTDIAADLPLTITKTDGAGALVDNRNGTWSWSLGTSDDASGTVMVQAADGDGGLTLVSFDYTAGNVAPAVGIEPLDTTGLEGATLWASGSFTDVAGDVPVTITKVSGDGTVVDNGNNSWSWSLTTTDDGSGVVIVQADDGELDGVRMTQFSYTATNRAPAVGTAPADATGNEGTTLGTSGSFTDVSGDPLVITRKSGAGTVTDNGDGTWSWSLATTDNASGNVVVEANDGDGGLTESTFSYTATNVAPAIGTAPANAAGNEGTTLSTSGTFTDVSGDRPLTLTLKSGAGTFADNRDGSWTWSLGTNDNTSGTVVVEADDGDGGLTESTFTYTAANVAPVIGPLAVTGSTGIACTTGNRVGLTFSVSDASSTDTMAGTINWGDGTTSAFTGRTVDTSHSYATGSYTITVTVSDDDGGAATSGPAAVNRQYAVSTIQAPFNADGTSVFKYGSVAPVKVTITDCTGAPVAGLAPTIRLYKVSSAAPTGTINETATSVSAADTTGVMRDAGNGTYIYNLATKSLSDGDARYTVIVTQGTSVSQNFGLRTK